METPYRRSTPTSQHSLYSAAPLVPATTLPPAASSARAVLRGVSAITLLLGAALGCSNVTVLSSGVESRVVFDSAATYDVIWRSTGGVRDRNRIFMTAINFDAVFADGSRGPRWGEPQRISTAEGSQPRLVRVSPTELFAAWLTRDGVYGQYLKSADLTPVYPDTTPIRLNPGDSGIPADLDLAYSDLDGRILVATNPPGAGVSLFAVTRDPEASPRFASRLVATLPFPGMVSRSPRIAVGPRDGAPRVLITVAVSRTIHFLLLTLDTSGTSTESFSDRFNAVGTVEAHQCVYDPSQGRFLEVYGDNTGIFSKVIYSTGAVGESTQLPLPPPSPRAPSVPDGSTTEYSVRVLSPGISFGAVALAGRESGSAFTFAYSEVYYLTRSTRYPTPRGRLDLRGMTTTWAVQTVFTQGLNHAGQVTGTRAERGSRQTEEAAGLMSVGREATLSPEAGEWHALVVDFPVLRYAERFQQP